MATAGACLSEDVVVRFLDRTLAPAHRAEVERHSDACDPCRSLLAELARTMAPPEALSAQPTELAEGRVVAGVGRARGAMVGRFVVLDVVGAGGMGVVHAAYDPDLDRKVAIKLLHADGAGDPVAARGRILREAQAMARLQHEHVVTVYEVGEIGDDVFIAMELVAGATLRQWLRVQRRTWREIADVFVQAGRGLAAAHDAGIVHRDFKPDNVLVAKDQRVKVMDFGLAGGDRGLVEEPGAVVGTPVYMAPEQLDGRPCDGRSDQFAFCVALHEALAGERPFAGDSPAALRAAIARGAPPLPARRAPGWLAAVIARGLAEDPAKRFPSMQALLVKLATRRRAWWRRVAPPVAVAAALGGVFWAARSPARAADPCTGAAEEIGEVWNPAIDAELRAAFAAIEAPYAADAWSRVSAALGRYTTAWAAARTAACRATRVDRHQSETALDLRVACLDRRKQEVAALVSVLAQPDAAIAQRAVASVQALSPLEACADLEALQAPVPPPRDRATAAQVRDVLAQLAIVDAQVRGARPEAARPLIAPLVERARALGYDPLIADARLSEAGLESALGNSKQSETALKEAVFAAAAGRHRRAEVLAWTRLIDEIGNKQARLADGLQAYRHAEAALTGYGHDDRLLAKILYSAGLLYRNRGDHAQAKATMERALGLLETDGDRDNLDLGAVYNGLGTVAFVSGDFDQALRRFQQSLEVRKRALGSRHPDVGKTLLNVGNVYKDRRNFDEALTTYREARDIVAASLPPTHPYHGEIEGNIGLVLMEQHHYDEALVHHLASLKQLEGSVGADHPSVGRQLNNLGLTLTYADRWHEALPYYERARALFVKVEGAEHADVAMIDHNVGLTYRDLGDLAQAERHFLAAIALRQKLAPDHPELARSLIELAKIRLRQRRHADAAALWERAIVVLDKVHGPTSVLVARPLLDVGWTWVDGGKPALAIAPLERALKIREAQVPPDAGALGVIRFTLAKALWATNRDRPRARALAEAARDVLTPVAGDKREDLDEITAWLAGHPPAP